jgi:hypothetical protein
MPRAEFTSSPFHRIFFGISASPKKSATTSKTRVGEGRRHNCAQSKVPDRAADRGDHEDEQGANLLIEENELSEEEHEASFLRLREKAHRLLTKNWPWVVLAVT